MTHIILESLVFQLDKVITPKQVLIIIQLEMTQRYKETSGGILKVQLINEAMKVKMKSLMF